MNLTPRELELLPGLPLQGQSSDQAAPVQTAFSETELARAAKSIGADPTELARLQSKLAADAILGERVYSLQAWDRQLATALAQVPVPANLELRVRQILALAEPTIEPVGLSAASLPERYSRRRWLRGIAVGGAAAAVGYLGWLNWPRSRTLDQNELADAGSWLDRYLKESRWSDVDFPFAEYPLPDVIRPAPFGWQAVTAELRTPAVAYDFSTDDGQRAALFVIPQPAGSFTTRVPFRPQSSTQGMCVGHWQQGPQLMVLVVQGNESRYRLFWRPERAVPVV
jgi:hypothetical protein